MARTSQQGFENKGNYKTPTYHRKASDNFRAKHDTINFSIEKGEKDIWRAAGFDNKKIIEVIRGLVAEAQAEQAEAKAKRQAELAKSIKPETKPDDIPSFD